MGKNNCHKDRTLEIILAIAIFIMACNNIDGWGWLVFILLCII